MTHSMRLNTGMTEPADFKETAEFHAVWNSQMCVCVCVCVSVCTPVISFPPCRALFTVLCSALQSERKSQWRGFQNTLQLLRKVFSPSSCSLTVFSFPFILLSLSHPLVIFPLHTHTHSNVLVFLISLLTNAVFWGNSILHKLQHVCVNRCLKSSGNWNVWRFLIKIILGPYIRQKTIPTVN